jgi:hypothetical protein
MKAFLLSVALFFSLSLFAQQQYSYVGIEILPLMQRDTIKYYMNVDRDNEHAGAVYELQSRSKSERVWDKIFYLSKSAVINKMAALGWDLVMIEPVVVTTKRTNPFEESHMNTHSQNFYLFRKQINSGQKKE